jgi:DNA-binding transcriptional LysR family regulator
MDELLIDWFLRVAQEGSVSAVARQVRRSASTVGRGLDELEADVGVGLLRRTPRGIELTAAGRAFEIEARALLAQIRRSRETAVRGSKGEGPVLRVGHVAAASYVLLPPILGELRSRFPELRMSITEALTTRLLKLLRERKLDVALLRKPVADDGLVEEALLFETLVLAVPEGHALAACDPVSLVDLAGIPLITMPRRLSPDMYDRQVSMLRRVGVQPLVEIGHGTHPFSLLLLVAAGLGVAIVPLQTAAGFNQRGVAVRSITPEPDPLALSMAWREGDTNPYVMAFAESARTTSIPASAGI